MIEAGVDVKPAKAKRRGRRSADASGRAIDTGHLLADQTEAARGRPLRILLLEDKAADAQTIERELQRAGLAFTVSRVATRAAFFEALEANPPDVVLTDYCLPHYNGAAALEHIRRTRPEVPVVIVTGALGEERAIELLKAGARDYVLKDNLLRLSSAVERAIAVERGIRARKAAERALLDSLKLLGTAERIAHIGGWHWDTGGEAVVWSEELYRIFGRDPTWSPTVAGFLAAVHSEDRDRIEAAIAASVERGASFDVEFRVVRPDGSDRTVATRAEMAHDKTGRVTAMTGTCHDVTEARRAEQKIREEEAKFRGLVEQNVAGVAIVRGDGTVGYANPYFAGLIGCEPAALIGRPLLDIVPEGEQALAAQRLCSQFKADGGFVQIETKMRARDGGERDILVNASPGIFEDKPASIAVVMDITERNRAAQELRDANIIVEQSPIVLFRALAADGFPCVYVSRNVARFGYTTEEVKAGAFKFPDFVHPDDRPAVLAALDRVRRQQEDVFEGDYRIVIRDGSTRWIHDRTVPIRDNAGRVVAYQGTLIDITERKLAERELAAQAALLATEHEASPDGILVVDAAAKIISVNRRFREVFRVPDGISVGEDDRPLLAWAAAQMADRDAFLARVGYLYEHPDESSREELRLTDGRFIDRFTMPMRAAAGDYIGRVWFFRDITDKVQDKLTLQRLNRALRTLSRGNEVVVRAASEQELLNEMCHVIVEQGGYSLAWVGVPLDDPEKTVRPLAWAGDGAEAIIGDLRVTWGDDAEGGGTCGRAIKSGTPQTSQNALADPTMAPWRDYMAKHGLAAAAGLPLKNSEVFGVLMIYAPEADAFDADELRLIGELADDLAYAIRALRDRAKAEEATRRWEASLESTIGAIASTVDMRDPYTAGHQQRVARLAAAIARGLGLPEDQIRGLYLAGVIHDVGKVVTPAEILNKPGKLSSLEFQLIQAHAQAGYDIIKGVNFLWPIAEMVRQHHERLDGSGYPRGLKGEEILREARILAVADVVEAMMSHRPYRPALGLGPALAEIEKGRGRVYDAAAVDACLKLFREKSFRFE